jgi:glycosyltransferase involved in cell wall biosynthesis
LAIESALSQEPPFAEVIVVDDGSTDHSVEVVRSYGSRVRLVEKANGGHLSACLAGLRVSAASYVHFLDSDDVAKPGLVAAVTAALMTAPVKVQFPLEAVDAAGVPTGSVFPHLEAEYGSKQMVEDNRVLGFYTCPPTSGNVYRRSALAGLDATALDGSEAFDGAPTLLLPYLGDIVSMPQPLVQYRIHGKNISQWYRPTVELLQQEIAGLYARWDQACVLLDWARPPFADEEPAYVSERRLMLAGLQGQRFVGAQVWAFVRRSMGSHLPAKHKVVLTMWAVLFLFPVPALRRQLVLSRRSASSRPRLVRWAVRVLRRGI